jgi:hypothetical protein
MGYAINMKRILSSLVILLIWAIPTLAASPVVEGIFPGVGQRGTEFRVTLSGGRLTDPLSILFYQSGLSCTKLVSTSETEVVATIKAEVDCKLGEHAFRLVTKSGASELRSLCIARLPIIIEAEADNNTTKSAQKVTSNSTIVGRIEASDVDCYAVELKKGQRLSAEIEAIRFGSPLDAVLAIHGPDGKKIVEVDDTPLFRQDPIASIVAATDGVYVVSVRETSFGGSDADRYALHLGSFIRPTAIFPPGGMVGFTTKVKLLGNPTGDREQIVKPMGVDFEFFPSDDAGIAPTASPFRVSNFPNEIESEPNDSIQSAASPLTWPIALNGVIEKQGDIDHFIFRAKAGEKLEVSAYAFQIGSPLDTVLTILNQAGQPIAANDDAETHDSLVRLTIPQDGVYVVRVEDKRKQGGPQFIYRIEITKQTQGLSVFLATQGRKSQDRGTIVVPKGNRVAAFLAVRRDSVEGPASIKVENLPDGVTIAGPMVVTADEYLLPVVVDASATASIGGKLVSITGTIRDVQGQFNQPTTIVSGPGDLVLHQIEVAKLAIVVVEEVPFTISIDQPKTSLTTSGSLDLVVRLNRGSGFEDPVEVSFPFLPPGVETPATVVIPEGKSEVVVSCVAKATAELGEWPLFVEAKPASATASRERQPGVASGGTGRRSRRTTASQPSVASQIISLRTAVSPVTATIAAAIGEQGKSVQFKLKVTSGAIPLGFVASLNGLPPRAVSKPVKITSPMDELSFDVEIDATTPTGLHPSLSCELVGAIDGQNVVYRVAYPGVLQVFPPGGVAVDKNGKPLSRLETLRLEQSSKKTP